MGAFAAAIPYIVQGVTVASAVVAAGRMRRAGAEQEIQYKQAALQEGDDAREQQIQRRRQLLRALASQTASAGAGGVEFSGSIATAARRDIEDAASDSLISDVNSKRKTRMLMASGRASRRAGDIAAASSILDSGVSAYKELG